VKKVVILNMKRYFGIKVLVKTTQQEIDNYLNKFATEKDKKFGGGDGKKLFCKKLLQELSYLDKMHDDYPFYRHLDPNAWSNFIEDCLILACLDHFLSGRPLTVVK